MMFQRENICSKIDQLRKSLAETLQVAGSVGACAVGGREEFLPLPRLKVSNVGSIPLPLIPQNVDVLRSMSSLSTSTARERIQVLDSSYVTLSKTWTTAMHRIAKRLTAALMARTCQNEAEEEHKNSNNTTVCAHLRQLVLYREGYESNQINLDDKVSDSDTFATMFVQLPCKFKGGGIYCDKQRVFDFSNNSDGSFFSLLFRSDCTLGMRRITSGTRLILLYDIVVTPSPSKSSPKTVSNELIGLLKQWAHSQKEHSKTNIDINENNEIGSNFDTACLWPIKLAFPLEHNYKDYGQNDNDQNSTFYFKSLHGNDALRAKLLRSCPELSVFLVRLKKTIRGYCSEREHPRKHVRIELTSKENGKGQISADDFYMESVVDNSLKVEWAIDDEMLVESSIMPFMEKTELFTTQIDKSKTAEKIDFWGLPSEKRVDRGMNSHHIRIVNSNILTHVFYKSVLIICPRQQAINVMLPLGLNAAARNLKNSLEHNSILLEKLKRTTIEEEKNQILKEAKNCLSCISSHARSDANRKGLISTFTLANEAISKQHSITVLLSDLLKVAALLGKECRLIGVTLLRNRFTEYSNWCIVDKNEWNGISNDNLSSVCKIDNAIEEQVVNDHAESLVDTILMFGFDWNGEGSIVRDMMVEYLSWMIEVQKDARVCAMLALKLHEFIHSESKSKSRSGCNYQYLSEHATGLTRLYKPDNNIVPLDDVSLNHFQDLSPEYSTCANGEIQNENEDRKLYQIHMKCSSDDVKIAALSFAKLAVKGFLLQSQSEVCKGVRSVVKVAFTFDELEDLRELALARMAREAGQSKQAFAQVLSMPTVKKDFYKTRVVLIIMADSLHGRFGNYDKGSADNYIMENEMPIENVLCDLIKAFGWKSIKDDILHLVACSGGKGDDISYIYQYRWHDKSFVDTDKLRQKVWTINLARLMVDSISYFETDACIEIGEAILKLISSLFRKDKYDGCNIDMFRLNFVELARFFFKSKRHFKCNDIDESLLAEPYLKHILQHRKYIVLSSFSELLSVAANLDGVGSYYATVSILKILSSNNEDDPFHGTDEDREKNRKTMIQTYKMGESIADAVRRFGWRSLNGNYINEKSIRDLVYSAVVANGGEIQCALVTAKSLMTARQSREKNGLKTDILNSDKNVENQTEYVHDEASRRVWWQAGRELAAVTLNENSSQCLTEIATTTKLVFQMGNTRLFQMLLSKVERLEGEMKKKGLQNMLIEIGKVCKPNSRGPPSQVRKDNLKALLRLLSGKYGRKKHIGLKVQLDDRNDDVHMFNIIRLCGWDNDVRTCIIAIIGATDPQNLIQCIKLGERFRNECQQNESNEIFRNAMLDIVSKCVSVFLELEAIAVETNHVESMDESNLQSRILAHDEIQSVSISVNTTGKIAKMIFHDIYKTGENNDDKLVRQAAKILRKDLLQQCVNGKVEASNVFKIIQIVLRCDDDDDDNTREIFYEQLYEHSKVQFLKTRNMTISITPTSEVQMALKSFIKVVLPSLDSAIIVSNNMVKSLVQLLKAMLQLHLMKKPNSKVIIIDSSTIKLFVNWICNSKNEELLQAANSEEIRSFILNSEMMKTPQKFKLEMKLFQRLVRSRMKQLDYPRPELTYDQPNAHVPGHPDVTSFLIGPKSEFWYHNFTCVIQARELAHVLNTNQGVYNCSITASANGRGTSSYVHINKNDDIYQKRLNKYEEDRDESFTLSKYENRLSGWIE